MTLKSIAFATAAAATLAIPSIAQAYWGQATGTVNMRACNSTACQKILAVPRGAQVWINGSAGSWYHVSYGGYQGYVSSSYVRTAFAAAPAPRSTVTFGFNVGNRPPAPTFGFVGRPYWDDRYNAWYDGRRWYANNRWYNAPPSAGFSFGFNIGG
jgi:uncharacterized protein YraI